MNTFRLRSIYILLGICLLLLPFANAQKIALMPKGAESNFWQIYIAGATSAAEELGVEITERSPTLESDVAAQGKIFDFFVRKGYDAIILTPLDRNALVVPVEEAIGNGTIVVLADSGLNTDMPASFIASDNRQAGMLGGEALAAKLGADTTGRILNVRYLKGSSSTDAREEGAYDALVAGLPNATVSKDLWGGVVLGGIKREIDSQLKTHADVVGILTTNTISTAGAYKSLKAKGLTGKITLIGSGVNDELLAGLESGEISGLYLQDPYEMGYLAVKTTVAIYNGEAVEKRIRTNVALMTKDNMYDLDKLQLIRP